MKSERANARLWRLKEKDLGKRTEGEKLTEVQGPVASLQQDGETAVRLINSLFNRASCKVVRERTNNDFLYLTNSNCHEPWNFSENYA